jgi:Mrp family chromosome partitioning ATPase
MTIWEQAYSKHKEGGSIQAYPQTDKLLHQKLSVPPDSVTPPQTKASDSVSFEEIFYQASKQQPVHQQAQEQAPQPIAISKPAKSRFSPRILSDELSKSYPKILSKMSYQLSDIWANILVETKQTVSSLLVCGATRKEGNTFISFYMSLFLSKEYNMKILYVDSNLNHATIPKIQNLPGLYSFVAENKDLASLIVQTEYPGLYLLPSGAGNIAKNVGGNMLSREPIEILMNYCRTNFDITIIDGQPLTTSPVMIEFARFVDMTALVCRYGYSRREVSKLAIDKLQKFGITSIGAILNDRQFPVPQIVYKIMG